jgi:hypothetical protein
VPKVQKTFRQKLQRKSYVKFKSSFFKNINFSVKFYRNNKFFKIQTLVRKILETLLSSKTLFVKFKNSPLSLVVPTESVRNPKKCYSKEHLKKIAGTPCMKICSKVNKENCVKNVKNCDDVL